MIKILYSVKKDEVLLEKQGKIFDFADNEWDPKNKYFKAMFGRTKVVAKIKDKKPASK